ncbi:DUF1992 domain-containing protein [Paenibacillus thermoaerophilus]|uniref:DUF1992 domain-containing protein n=1 Tax=Paenibacillus thermoaerophilus TaxID=1215385 RepID=A0ABW2V3M8_9BACL|nr:DUF1992 domain-containing protein [Paenibacillus thermoaerophilus]TMV13917.1 DUF1992 domain-containing protein [Paenibacillus thermoaerophilus]
MDWKISLAEERIREAQRNGDFDNLPLLGKPLPKDTLEGVPEELRMGMRLLKNAGMLPEELQLLKEIASIEDLLRCCRDEEEAARLRNERSAKQLRFQQLAEARGWDRQTAFAFYREKIERKWTE